MATVSLQKEEGSIDSHEARDCQMQGDASLSSSVPDPKGPRVDPEEDNEVFRDQAEEILTELVQDSHEALRSPLSPSLGASSRETCLEKEVSECSGVELNSNEDLESLSSFNIGPPRNIPTGDVQQETPNSTDEGEEETTKDIYFCPRIVISCEYSADVVPSDNQQRELLPQGLQGPTPKGANQEAAQQVLGQTAAPLSAVSMELSNQDGAASKGCAVTVREKKAGRVGQRTEGESETGEQKDGRLERNTVVAQGEGIVQENLEEQIRMESDSSDDSQSDSGLSADFSPRSTSNVSATTLPKETPIDKEIRRAIEREHSLRRSRGMQNTSAEYVDIPLRKTLLDQVVSASSDKYQGLDRELASKKVQQEISEELRREQDLVKLGKVPGAYHKGTVRQLKEKKKLFEAFQNHRDPLESVPSRSKTSSWSSSSDSSSGESHDDSSSQASTVRSIEAAYTSPKARGPGLSEGTSCQIIIVENNMTVPGRKIHHGNMEVDGLIRVNPKASHVFPSGSKDEEMAANKNPFFTLRSPSNVVKVEQDIREDQEREKELRKQRVHLYGDEGGTMGGAGGGLRRSLQASGPAFPGSASKGGSGYTAGRPSVGKLGVWPPGEDHGETINQPKVLQTSHSSRHKTPLVRLWESGLVNGHKLEGQ
ncbi:uncharacterized protein misp3 isoform X1 [Nerophis lumbriciformis]|uniref:uncharacterized protein misp3 isoform X1 n=1 Tax=Nerophis lumbriciformis TaxID=546530 RepID=UPI002AE04079|nr:mitotic interactor and substrate of PLK1-like isoform X1 [Nerophis lumbriciformis]XP_061839741.1 mitotic interactor and substrate of PLK1-like isoform X1 [Nerophis lumbriciformis]